MLRIVHMVRNSMPFVPRKDYKDVTADLIRIYQAPTEQEGLVQFEEVWNADYPQISKSWRNNLQLMSICN